MSRIPYTVVLPSQVTRIVENGEQNPHLVRSAGRRRHFWRMPIGEGGYLWRMPITSIPSTGS